MFRDEQANADPAAWYSSDDQQQQGPEQEGPATARFLTYEEESMAAQQLGIYHYQQHHQQHQHQHQHQQQNQQQQQHQQQQPEYTPHVYEGFSAGERCGRALWK